MRSILNQTRLGDDLIERNPSIRFGIGMNVLLNRFLNQSNLLDSTPTLALLDSRRLLVDWDRLTG